MRKKIGGGKNPKKEQQLQYIEKTTFVHFQKVKGEIKTTFVVFAANWKQESLTSLEQGQTEPFTVACG